MMDCDTTGIEPDLGLVKMKKLVGGGTMSIVNQTIPRALRRLGYDAQQVDDIIAYIDEQKSILGAPHLAAEHVSVFACSMGDNTIHYEGHVRMMGAVQPFLSGAISKTVNMPEEATRRRRRGTAPAQLGARPQGRRDLPRQLQGRPAAVDGEEGRCSRRRRHGRRRRRSGHRDRREGRREDRARPIRQKLPRSRTARNVRVPRRRLQGLRHDRRVRERPARRDLPDGVQAGFDPRRHHGRVREVDQLRPAVRRADAGVRRGVREHEVRAGRHDRRPRRPVRGFDHGLPVPSSRPRVHDATTSAPSSASSRSTSAHSRRCPASTRPSSRRVRAPRSWPTRRACRRSTSSPPASRAVR